MSKVTHTPGPWRVGDLVETLFDEGIQYATLYGTVIKAGPKTVTIRWESGVCNRVVQGRYGIKLARDMEVARAVLARGEG